MSPEPRPFYIVGHNPNTIGDVISALNAGANAIEPDVNVFQKYQDQLCISHDEGGTNAPSLTKFLSDLHKVAIDRPDLALVVFDCKPKVARAQNGLTLLNSIRTLLTSDTNLNVIISVSQLSEKAIFDMIKNSLRLSEGLMVDEDNDPIAVSNFFTQDRVSHQCYGNGISILNDVLGPNVRPSMERACEFRAATNKIRFIYVWTVNNENLMREYIKIGVDGIITDDVRRLRNIVFESQFQPVIHLAKRSDNPFMPVNTTYGLVIHTGDKWMAGTDANVTFTLTGKNGFASVTVDTNFHSRMERNSLNYVTLCSRDLGNLQSITVQRDNKGNAPDWYLDYIIVESFHYGVPNKRANFNRWIDSTSPFTQSFN